MTETNKGGSRLETGAASHKNGWLIALAVLLAVPLVAYGACCALAATSEGIFPRTTVLGSDVSGMSEAEAEEFLAPLLPAAYEENGISIRLDGEELWMASLTELGFSPRAEEAAKLAYSSGRSGNILLDGLAYGQALVLGREITPPLNLTQQSVESAADAILQKVNREAQPLRCDLAGSDDRSVRFIQAQEGIALDEGYLLQELGSLLKTGQLSAIDCQYKTLPYDSSVTVESLAAELLNERKNAGYDAATDSITEATVGVAFDVAEAREKLAETAPGEAVSVPGSVEFPAVYARDLEGGVLFRDQLATFSTNLTGTAGRIGNVRLAAKACNGMVLNSGDEFSFNKRVGKRTEARGYRPAPAYLAGETVDTIGGGICQVSSTIYAACLHANLEITERTAHRYVSSYIKDGLDATVSWGTLDYKFRNNTDYPIKIVTETANGKISVMLYGTKVDDSYVVMTTETFDRTGFNTQYVDSPELPVGTEEVKQTAYSGCKVQSYRNVYKGDGTLISSVPEALSHYKSRDKIILVGIGGSGDSELDGWFNPDDVLEGGDAILPGFNDEPLMDDPYVDDPMVDNGEGWVFPD